MSINFFFSIQDTQSAAQPDMICLFSLVGSCLFLKNLEQVTHFITSSVRRFSLAIHAELAKVRNYSESTPQLHIQTLSMLERKRKWSVSVNSCPLILDNINRPLNETSKTQNVSRQIIRRLDAKRRRQYFLTFVFPPLRRERETTGCRVLSKCFCTMSLAICIQAGGRQVQVQLRNSFVSCQFDHTNDLLEQN